MEVVEVKKRIFLSDWLNAKSKISLVIKIYEYVVGIGLEMIKRYVKLLTSS